MAARLGPDAPGAQGALREALNAWLGRPRQRAGVMEALAAGGRLDQGVEPGAEVSIIHSCAEMAFEEAHWSALVDFSQAAPFDANVLDASGSAPLHRAAAAGNEQAILGLLAMGADPALADGQGLLPIHRCCAMEDPSCESKFGVSLKALLEAFPAGASARVEPSPSRFDSLHGGDPLAWDPEHLRLGSPVHFAARSGMARAPSLLKARGADLDEAEPLSSLRPIDIAMDPKRSPADRFELTAMELARHGCQIELPSLPVGAGLSPLRRSLGLGWTALAKELLLLGASLKAPSQSGPVGEPLMSMPTEKVASADSAGFWRGFMAMVHDEMAVAPALDPSSSRAIKIAKRSLR